MARTCSFEWSTSPGTEERKKIQVDFPDEDWDTLMAYFEYTKELEKAKLIQEGGPASCTINWKEGEGLSYSMNVPSDNDFQALLHNLRPFVLKSESTYFLRICKILARRISDENFRRFLKSLRHYFDGGRMTLNDLNPIERRRSELGGDSPGLSERLPVSSGFS